MKGLNISFLVAAAVALFLVTGCDFLRALAGRPTSADIAAIREVMHQDSLAEQARLDSIALAEAAALKEAADSANASEALMAVTKIVRLSSMTALYKTELSARWYIGVGSFRIRTNAENFLKKYEDLGYTGCVASFRSGMNSVLICPSDRLQDVYEAYLRVSEEAITLDGIWVLANE